MDIKERDLRLWAGYDWHRRESSCGLCEHGNETVMNGGRILDYVTGYLKKGSLPRI
jgi:hypothetical protein